MRFVDPTGYDGFDDVYLGPGMQAWVKPEQDSGSGEAGGGGGGGGGNGFHYSYTDHAYEDANGNIVGWNYVFNNFVQPNAVNFTGPVFKITSQGIDIPFIDTYQGGLEIGDKWITWQDLVNYSSPGAGSGDQTPWWEDNDFASFFYNPYGIKETEQNEYRTRYANPIGVLTVRHFTDKITGSGTINIVHDELSNEINVLYDAELGIGSISLGDSGFTISVGIRNNVEIGLNQNGIMVGYSSHRNGIISGTEYSWRPSALWYFLATAPVQIANPTFVY